MFIKFQFWSLLEFEVFLKSLNKWWQFLEYVKNPPHSEENSTGGVKMHVKMFKVEIVENNCNKLNRREIIYLLCSKDFWENSMSLFLKIVYT